MPRRPSRQKTADRVERAINGLLELAARVRRLDRIAGRHVERAIEELRQAARGLEQPVQGELPSADPADAAPRGAHERD